MPKKVAILGGGASALAAAIELSDPRHGGEFEVTIHQLGWRLGGKCASGREMDVSLRIKEHGPHIFLGFYDNAFALLREVYAQRPTGARGPFATIEDALVPQRSLATMEQVDGAWLPWVINTPVMPGRPGDAALTGSQVVMRILRWIDAGIDFLDGEPSVGPFPDIADVVLESISNTVNRLTTDVLVEQPVSDIVVSGLRGLQVALHGNWDAIEALLIDIRRIRILVDLGIATVIGALVDNLLVPTRASVAAANKIEYSDWLRRHGAREATVKSAVVRAMYDTVFGYPDGDVTKLPNAEAGSAFLVQRAMMGYHNVLFWKMGAGTGDVVAAPIYQVLRDREVKVEFFHRVDKLMPSADGTRIDKILIGRQATVKHPPYDPLIGVPGPAGDSLLAWPDRPLYDQLDEGADLKSSNIDLESRWTPWVDPKPQLVLDRDNGDFDIAIVAMPPEALKLIAPDLPTAAWSDMFTNVASVQTCSVQLWMTRTLKQTGWTALADPTVSGYDTCQLDTWFDASDVLKREGWPANSAPVQMAMLCGPMLTPRTLPPRSNHDFPATMKAQAFGLGTAFLNKSAPLWPDLQTAAGFDMNALFSPTGAAGPARLKEQYWVAAINPSDRYVQTLVGTSRFRLATDGSGYDNLLFCGDWTDYGFNFGCFEGAIISGLQAANHITGDPRPILNDPFEWK